ncbi:MAG: alpha-ketoglutarate-dependent dioxygenase AlkB family protein [Maricaulaceae bacterium]
MARDQAKSKGKEAAELPQGFAHYPLYFDAAQQQALIEAVKAGAEQAPFYIPRMPRTGTPMSVALSNFGSLGWVSDKDGGYRYQAGHPKTGAPWAKLPQALLDLWYDVTDYTVPPEACLINWYREGSKMGMHIDNDEQDIKAPVVSVSLGDPAMFRLGGPQRGGATHGLKLFSGDVVVLAGASRLCYHGVSKVYYGESALVPKGGRINLTMRRVHPA